MPGRKIEESTTTKLFSICRAHPYTRGLMASMSAFPCQDRKRRLPEISGKSLPSLRGENLLPAAPSSPRCAYAVRPFGVGSAWCCARLATSYRCACHRPSACWPHMVAAMSVADRRVEDLRSILRSSKVFLCTLLTTGRQGGSTA